MSKNANNIAGYYSTDNETWNLIGTMTTTGPVMPNLFYTGFVASSTNSSLNTAVFDTFTYAASVPQPASNLLAWYRSDVGVVSSAGAVSTWKDQSGNSLDATQSTGANKPTLSTGQINNSVLPALTFNGTSQYLSVPTDFSNMTAGASMFVVFKPTSATATCTACAFGNAANSDAIFAQAIAKNASLSVYNSSTSSSVTTTGTPLSTTAYQLLEETFQPGASAGTGIGTIYVNGVQKVQSTTMVQNMNNVSRTQNFLGCSIGVSNYFQGGIAEVLVYNAPLSSTQRHALESYVFSKYGIGSAPTLDAPTFSPPTGTYTAPLSVSPVQGQNSVIWYTTNGATPSVSTSSQWFTAVPLNLTSNTTVQALGSAPFYANSSVSSASYMFDQETLPITRTNLALWLRGDQVTLASGKVSSWADLSGSGNTASQGVSGNQPTYVSSAVNGLPGVSFNGSSSFLQITNTAGLSNFASGASIFAVVKPSSVTANARLLDFGNGAASDNIYISEPTSTGVSLVTYNGASSTTVTSSSGVTLGNYQLLEFVDNGTGTATVYTNAVQGAQNTSMNSLSNIARTLNYIGQGAAGGNYFNGTIAELLVYQRGVTTSERASIEGYLMGRYQLLSANSTPAPTISVAAGTLSAPTQVAIEAPFPAKIYFTVDGSAPTTSSTPYTTPVTIGYSQTLKAIAVVNGISSSVASAAYTLDSTQWPAPASTTTPMQVILQYPTVSIPHDSAQH
ncbi:MAG TPA: LamG-like jellyroll fold domain-containing protein [Chroococcales cyanobacterium]